jgi:hypothetical protein
MKALCAIAAAGLVGLAGVSAVVTSGGGSSDGGGTTGGWFNITPGDFHGCVKALPPDLPYQAQETQWAFSDTEARLQFALGKSQPRYALTATAPASTGNDGLTVHVALLGNEVFAFPAHEFTVFDIVGHRLYYADFDPAAAGAAVVSVDLTTGTELWRTQLKGVGDGAGAAYQTRLNLTADEAGVTVLGNETGGKYVEVLDAETGETGGHRVVE